MAARSMLTLLPPKPTTFPPLFPHRLQYHPFFLAQTTKQTFIGSFLLLALTNTSVIIKIYSQRFGGSLDLSCSISFNCFEGRKKLWTQLFLLQRSADAILRGGARGTAAPSGSRFLRSGLWVAERSRKRTKTRPTLEAWLDSPLVKCVKGLQYLPHICT